MLTRFFVSLVIVVLASVVHAQSPKRFAIVIGNDAYRTVEPLKNARNDARLFAQAMRDAKFEVIAQDDLSRDQFWGLIDKVKARINKGDELVFYFAGHGVQIGANQYLLPVDIPLPDSDRQVERSAIPLVEVLDSFSDARVSVFVIDACRDNPFPKKATRSIGNTRGLARPEPTTGQIVILSAGRDQKALDSVPGNGSRNGLFTWELVQVIRNNNPEVRSAFEAVKERVDDIARKVNHQQRPAVSHDLRGNFFFFPGAGQAVAAYTPPVQRAETKFPSIEEVEVQAWEDTQRVNTAGAYQAFLTAYPASRFAGRARIGLAALVSSPSLPAGVTTAVQNSPRQQEYSLSASGDFSSSATLQKIASSGRITMGVREASGVFSYSLGGGRYAGYHVEICQKVIGDIEKRLGRRIDVQYVPVTSQNRIPMIQNGTVDIECGSTTNNAIRQKDVAFLPTTFVEEVRMVVRANSGISNIGQLGGKTVVTTTGTTSAQTLRNRATGVDFKEVFGRDHSDSFLQLESGRADAFVMDSSILAGNIAASKNPSDFRIVGEILSAEPIAIMIRKDDSGFKRFGEETIVGLIKTGEMSRLWDKWFTQPIPPRNLRLGLNLNESTRAAWAVPNDRPVEDYFARR
ncbi:MAG: transporter substrate-binding domain-containing protein [Polaromonas sp.]|nr:transporter substrate-binding domain-containing protein [Polaromonas sp.]